MMTNEVLSAVNTTIGNAPDHLDGKKKVPKIEQHSGGDDEWHSWREHAAVDVLDAAGLFTHLAD